MKTGFLSNQGRGAFTLIEMLVVVFIIVILVGLLLPVLHKAKTRSKSVSCLNNLKQISFALNTWSYDHQDQYPWRVATNSGGAKGVATAWKQYITLSNYLSSPTLLHCPADEQRETAIDFSADPTGLQTLTNLAVTYFLGVEANHKTPEIILAGDRATGVRGECVIAGMGDVIMLNNNAKWDAEIHGTFGNTAFEDGSVHQLSDPKFKQQLQAVAKPGYNNCAL